MAAPVSSPSNCPFVRCLLMADEGRCVSCGFLGKQDRREDTAIRCPGTFEVKWLERVKPAGARAGVNPWAQAIQVVLAVKGGGR